MPVASLTPPTRVSGINPIDVAIVVNTTGHPRPRDAGLMRIENSVFNVRGVGVARRGVTRRVHSGSNGNGVDTTDHGGRGRGGRREGSAVRVPDRRGVHGVCEDCVCVWRCGRVSTLVLHCPGVCWGHVNCCYTTVRCTHRAGACCRARHCGARVPRVRCRGVVGTRHVTVFAACGRGCVDGRGVVSARGNRRSGGPGTLGRGESLGLSVRRRRGRGNRRGASGLGEHEPVVGA